MFDKYFDELNIGERWVSRGRTITEADLVLFSAFSGDWYPLHTDKEWAAQTSFGQRIAHGMLVLSVAMGLLDMVPGPIVAFYGIERVRFIGPTYIGDTLYAEVEVTGKEEKDAERGVAGFKIKVISKANEIKAIMDIKILMKKTQSD
ncbi:Acyl dehydratase [Desulfotomaculum arcticum]|uniref:Acyl dehydratase n=1 Tax=Desulfotruncus arcticus DSM 17038 TaxID=1121424 RepID=A0A1I2TL27_9FIRM|nr:MaoC/PaaZ C-terminal domain-containing protein [Desulfotruncus arcticus]SFG63041.1 Acyl dehydratase [Desulfotomaculum arcticum] [Desulfotruncus arcticus DSM 17038]